MGKNGWREGAAAGRAWGGLLQALSDKALVNLKNDLMAKAWNGDEVSKQRISDIEAECLRRLDNRRVEDA